MSKLQWFRLYHRIIDDEKIRLLAFEDRWHFIALCCLKADGLLDEPESGLRDRKIAVKIGVQARELDEIKRRLLEVGLVDENMQPVAWDTLQYTSDTSTDRVRKHREKTNASSKKQAGNVSVTPPEAETEAEAEAETEAAAARGKSDLDTLTDRLLDAAGDKIQPHGAIVLAPILGLMQAGCDLETDILPTIKARSSKMARPAGSWAYFVAAIQEAHARRIEAGRGVSKPKTIEASEKRWRSRLQMARDQCTWSTQEWGPRPGLAGCLVPAELLETGDGLNWKEWENAA